MTLRNKIAKLIYTYTSHYNSNLTKEMEIVADKYAIGFAEWINYRNFRAYSNGWANFETKAKTSKELLEIYKKEKNL